MKNKKGFTLVELIGIIVLLAVIMLVVAPIMINTLKNNDEKRFQSFKENLKMAAENYIVDNKNTSMSSIEITLQTLLENKYISEIPTIPAEDPLAVDGNESLENGFVIATKTNGIFVYQLCKNDSGDSDSCEIIE